MQETFLTNRVVTKLRLRPGFRLRLSATSSVHAVLTDHQALFDAPFYEPELVRVLAQCSDSITSGDGLPCNSRDLPETIEYEEEDRSRDVPPKPIEQLTKHETLN